jgi:ADP-ribose pyrophosphatase
MLIIPSHAVKVFSGLLHDVYQWQQEMFDGSYQTFEGLKRPDAVVVIALTKGRKIIVNYERQPGSDPFIGLPSGSSEQDDLLREAQRELEEETGYTSNQWKKLYTADILHYDRMEWSNHVYVANNCELNGMRSDDPGEQIELQLVSFEEFISLSQLPEFRNGEMKRRIFTMLHARDHEEELEAFRRDIFD